MRYLTLTTGLLLVLLFCVPWLTHASKIAIVIDDIGYRTSDKKLLQMDANLTYAILPHTPFGRQYAQFAALNHKDVLIHLPMQAHKNNRLLGPGALTSSMNKAQYQQTLLKAIEDIPYAVGINNHMGSLLTQQQKPMNWTMELLRQHNLFFLDSKTTVHSKVTEVAEGHGVATLQRHIFLDHQRDEQFIRKQFQRLINIAKKHGQAVAIGHPYPETIEVLTQLLGQLDHQGVNLVSLSSLIHQQDDMYLVESGSDDTTEPEPTPVVLYEQ